MSKFKKKYPWRYRERIHQYRRKEDEIFKDWLNSLEIPVVSSFKDRGVYTTRGIFPFLQAQRESPEIDSS